MQNNSSKGERTVRTTVDTSCKSVLTSSIVFTATSRKTPAANRKEKTKRCRDEYDMLKRC